jgi:hypothetical protein
MLSPAQHHHRVPPVQPPRPRLSLRSLGPTNEALVARVNHTGAVAATYTAADAHVGADWAAVVAALDQLSAHAKLLTLVPAPAPSATQGKVAHDDATARRGRHAECCYRVRFFNMKT